MPPDTVTPSAPSARRVPALLCRRFVRGAALLDVMFTLTALMAGAQGFAHWQTAGSMTSAELAATPSALMMAMPSPDSVGVSLMGGRP